MNLLKRERERERERDEMAQLGSQEARKNDEFIINHRSKVHQDFSYVSNIFFWLKRTAR